MVKKYLTNNPSQTKKLGEILAKEILKTKIKKRAFIIGLEGDLGGGKTTFLQGLAKGLGIKEKILSPTFIIMRKFRIPKVISHKSLVNSQWFFHIDCYRISKPKEILDLGLRQIVSKSENIVAIEWAGKIKKILPNNIIWVNFEFIDKNVRKIIIKEKK